MQKFDHFFVTYNGKHYDIANFINRHPGGTDAIIPYQDQDITAAFDHIGHSEDAKNLLKKRLLNPGTEVTNDVPTINQVEKENEKEKSEKAKEKEIIKGQEEQALEDQTISRGKFVVRKLFTPEDKYYIHKFLGSLALISFIYRYFYVLPTTGRLMIENDIFSYLTLFIHMLLSSSAFIFHVLPKRITENALIIYKEYQIHAVIFTSRAVFVSIFGLLMHHLPFWIQQLTLLLVILIIHLCVDYVTNKYGTPGVTAVRNENTETGYRKMGLRVYSFYQFAALGSHLVVDPNLKDLGFNAIIAIQSSAFLMTLKRKNIIKWYWHAIFYSLALGLSFTSILICKGYEFFIHILIIYMIRVTFNVSKYPLWLCYVAGIYWLNNKNFLQIF